MVKSIDRYLRVLSGLSRRKIGRFCIFCVAIDSFAATLIRTNPNLIVEISVFNTSICCLIHYIFFAIRYQSLEVEFMSVLVSAALTTRCVHFMVTNTTECDVISKIFLSLGSCALALFSCAFFSIIGRLFLKRCGTRRREAGDDDEPESGIDISYLSPLLVMSQIAYCLVILPLVWVVKLTQFQIISLIHMVIVSTISANVELKEHEKNGEGTFKNRCRERKEGSKSPITAMIMPPSIPPSFAPTSTSEEEEVPMDILLQKEAGTINSEQNEKREAVAVRFFDKLVTSKCILQSGYDNVSNQMRYKLGKDTHNLLNGDFPYRKGLDTDTDVAELEHLSLIFEGTDFKILRKCVHLRTLLLHHSKIEDMLDELFMELKLLITLDLSCTDVVHLPPSIGNLKELKYLDLSKSPIRWLPESVASLGSLETLVLIECRSLYELPRCTSELINLKNLVVGIPSQLISMPTHIGKLVNLETMPTFIVGTDDGSRIGELMNMNKLKGSLTIRMLENIRDKDEAKKAMIYDKKHLKKLEFEWTDDIPDGKNTVEEGILESLQPPKGIEELIISFYSGGLLPTWMSDPAFNKISSIILHNCSYCEKLPSFGELPSLKILIFFEMDGVDKIDNLFCRKGANRNAFPRLEKLALEGFSNLKVWTGVEEGDFPALKELSISYCPLLVEVPSVSSFTSLRYLRITDCPELPRSSLRGEM